MGHAAIFDLDRTLIPGSSAQVFSPILADLGIGAPGTPAQSLYFRFFERFGEDPISMRLARQAVQLFTGQRVATVEAAGLLAADVLAGEIPPHAQAEIENHRRAGASLVMATTSPFELVSPLAQSLGFDELICTRYHSVDGIYDGYLDGPYVWGPDKAQQVARWAGEHAIDLSESFAYSDSFYDLPLLESVGTPIAVNPDLRLRTAAASRGWTIRDFEHPPGVPSLAGIEGQELLFPFFNPSLSVFAEIELAGSEHVPESGPVILAANHRSYFDPLAVAYIAASRRRPVRFLAKKEVLDAPVVGHLVTALGAIRVDRGSGSDAPLEAAAAALDAGEVVAIFPEATIPRTDGSTAGELQGRTGAVRLAQRTGAPIVPVGLWGTEQVWPRDQRMPRIDVAGDRPLVRIRVGEPYTVTKRSKPEAATTKLMRRIAELLPPDEPAG